MTKDEIIEMAVQAGMTREVLPLMRNLELLTNFAKLVAEKEREAHRSYIHELERELEVTQDKLNECLVADYIKNQGDKHDTR